MKIKLIYVFLGGCMMIMPASARTWTNTSGNNRAIDGYAKTASASGWLVIAADTDLGNPRQEDNQRAGPEDMAVHQNAVETLTKAWPGFQTWEFACSGCSGGAKASFYRANQLLVLKLNVIGLFLGGCNENMTADARRETGCNKTQLHTIKVFLSNGTSDKISTVAQAKAVEKSLNGDGYGKIQLDLCEGEHRLHKVGLQKALDWFIATDSKPSR